MSACPPTSARKSPWSGGAIGLEILLAVAIGAGPRHATFVRIFVAARAVAHQAEEAHLPLGEYRSVRIRMTLGAREVQVRAAHRVTDESVIELPGSGTPANAKLRTLTSGKSEP
jgi:hypothetical protein